MKGEWGGLTHNLAGICRGLQRSHPSAARRYIRGAKLASSGLPRLPVLVDHSSHCLVISSTHPLAALRRAVAPASLIWLAMLAFGAPARLAGQDAAPLPLKHAAQPTQPAITAADLETRLYIYADDSMAGRRAGTEGDLKATAYIAAEFKRFGLVPAGDSGTYFQNIPLVTYAYDTTTPMQVGSRALHFGTDFMPISRRVPSTIDGDPVVFGGPMCDPTATRLTDAQVAGKVVVYSLPAGSPRAQIDCLRGGAQPALPKSAASSSPHSSSCLRSSLPSCGSRRRCSRGRQTIRCMIPLHSW